VRAAFRKQCTFTGLWHACNSNIVGLAEGLTDAEGGAISLTGLRDSDVLPIGTPRSQKFLKHDIRIAVVVRVVEKYYVHGPVGIATVVVIRSPYCQLAVVVRRAQAGVRARWHEGQAITEGIRGGRERRRRRGQAEEGMLMVKLGGVYIQIYIYIYIYIYADTHLF
jgi:hypothetical protein